MRDEEDPQVKTRPKDVGIGSTSGALRRVAVARGRDAKARSRKTKLAKLGVGAVTPQLRIYKGSIAATGLYGHQSMGVPPKRMTWYRHTIAGILGRQSLGSTDIVLDKATGVQDPEVTVHRQHVQTWSRLVPDERRSETTWRRPGQSCGPKLRHSIPGGL